MNFWIEGKVRLYEEDYSSSTAILERLVKQQFPVVERYNNDYHTTLLYIGGPHQFSYTWDGNVIYQGTAYDNDLDAELDRCQKVMEDLDAKNSYVELRPCGCCQQNVNEDLLCRCHFCGESRCLHECFIESEGICKCCFYGNTEMDDDNPDPCCEHCEDHGRPSVYHTTTTGMLQRPLGDLEISENYGTESFY